jgi:hypothetical protein
MNDGMNDEPARKMPNGLKPFSKGDPRINRSGRPKTFAAFRELAQKIMAEKLVDPDGKVITVAEAILRRMAKSNDPVANRIALEYAFGKVPDKLETTGLENQTKLVLYYAHERAAVERQALEREKALALELPPDEASRAE